MRRLTEKKVLLAALCVFGVVALIGIGANAYMLLSTNGDSTPAISSSTAAANFSFTAR